MEENRDFNDDERAFFSHFYRGRSVSSEHENSESEHSEKSPLVSTKSLAKLLFHRSMSTQDNGPNSSKDNNESPTRLIFLLFNFLNVVGSKTRRNFSRKKKYFLM